MRKILGPRKFFPSPKLGAKSPPMNKLSPQSKQNRWAGEVRLGSYSEVNFTRVFSVVDPSLWNGCRWRCACSPWSTL